MKHTQHTLLCTLGWLLLAGSLTAQTFTTPPTQPVRTAAEWEEVQALVVTWTSFSSILTEIVRAGREQCNVIVCCNDQNVVNAAKTVLQNAGVDITSNVDFRVVPINTVWVRDYGANTVYANRVDSLMLVDWIYNRNRIKDNNVPVVLGTQLGIPVYSTSTAPYDLVNTGGNFMSDGNGTAFASELVFRNNNQIEDGEGAADDVFGTSDRDEVGIDTVMERFMGIERYIKMPELPFDGIHHIDMHMKLLDEETLLVGQYPEGTSDGPQIEANLQYVLANYKSMFGTDFKVIRVPMPAYNEPGQYPPFNNSGNLSALYPTYANAVFVNKTVILPKYNLPEDVAARDTFQKYLPGHNVVQINCNSMIYSGGAIHCITHTIGVYDPLLMVHQPLRDCYNTDQPSAGYPVVASFEHRSGVQSGTIWWTTDTDLSTANWQSTPLSATGSDDLWQGSIPLQTPGSTIHYYLEATATNGKTLTRPLTGPAGSWAFNVLITSQVTEVTPDARLNTVYPNPARAITCVPVNATTDQRGSLRLVNALGQVVSVLHEGNFPTGNSNWFFDARNFTPGVYAVELTLGNGTRSSSRVVVVK